MNGRYVMGDAGFVAERRMKVAVGFNPREMAMKYGSVA
jgi:hypothetical protein